MIFKNHDTNTKKKLRKVKKHWIVVASLISLATVGTYSEVAQPVSAAVTTQSQLTVTNGDELMAALANSTVDQINVLQDISLNSAQHGYRSAYYSGSRLKVPSRKLNINLNHHQLNLNDVAFYVDKATDNNVVIINNGRLTNDGSNALFLVGDSELQLTIQLNRIDTMNALVGDASKIKLEVNEDKDVTEYIDNNDNPSQNRPSGIDNTTSTSSATDDVDTNVNSEATTSTSSAADDVDTNVNSEATTSTSSAVSDNVDTNVSSEATTSTSIADTNHLASGNDNTTGMLSAPNSEAGTNSSLHQDGKDTEIESGMTSLNNNDQSINTNNTNGDQDHDVASAANKNKDNENNVTTSHAVEANDHPNASSSSSTSNVSTSSVGSSHTSTAVDSSGGSNSIANHSLTNQLNSNALISSTSNGDPISNSVTKILPITRNYVSTSSLASQNPNSNNDWLRSMTETAAPHVTSEPKSSLVNNQTSSASSTSAHALTKNAHSASASANKHLAVKFIQVKNNRVAKQIKVYQSIRYKRMILNKRAKLTAKHKYKVLATIKNKQGKVVYETKLGYVFDNKQIIKLR